ncbi:MULTISPECIES: molybdopterin converting factor subunit 1 [unclassified Sphingomonas]|jgi:molybdopterin synthase sulfur carrier subunit|uniref:molybdopterin converting factor subunit 1 n=1 Tax=unclassified Sphingomonas TaxID=196159 RepID=UPI000836691B|nr:MULTISPECIES: molybdopterin converting factor subunit 1 [unclassified Sphingomonas]
MALRLLYFAWVRERIGTGEEQVTPPEAVTTAVQLIDWLAKQSEAHAAAFADRDRLRVAIDQKFAALDTPLAGAREVAIFPPVTGG